MPRTNRVVVVLIVTISILTTTHADARPTQAPKPIVAPAELVKARSTCLRVESVESCLRGKLRVAYRDVAWQQKARTSDAKRAQGYGVMHALRLASALYGVPINELVAVGTCESHLTPTSKNRTSTASGLFQFLDSTWNRAGLPGFSVFDAYANAIAAARLVTKDGSWREWSCKP